MGDSVLRRLARDHWVRLHGTPRVTVLVGGARGRALWHEWLALSGLAGPLLEGELEVRLREAVASAVDEPARPIAVLASPEAAARWRAGRRDRLAALADEGWLMIDEAQAAAEAGAAPFAGSRAAVWARDGATSVGDGGSSPGGGGSAPSAAQERVDLRSTVPVPPRSIGDVPVPSGPAEPSHSPHRALLARHLHLTALRPACEPPLQALGCGRSTPVSAQAEPSHSPHRASRRAIGLGWLPTHATQSGSALASAGGAAASGGAAPADRAHPAILDARSLAEATLYEALQATPATAGRFALNASLSVRFGGKAAEIDLLSRGDRVAVEIDGIHHFAEPGCYRRDRRKDLLLQTEGFVVVRLLAEDVVRDVRAAVNVVCQALAYRRGEAAR